MCCLTLWLFLPFLLNSIICLSTWDVCFILQTWALKGAKLQSTATVSSNLRAGGSEGSLWGSRTGWGGPRTAPALDMKSIPGDRTGCQQNYRAALLRGGWGRDWKPWTGLNGVWDHGQGVRVGGSSRWGWTRTVKSFSATRAPTQLRQLMCTGAQKILCCVVMG